MALPPLPGKAGRKEHGGGGTRVKRARMERARVERGRVERARVERARGRGIVTPAEAGGQEHRGVKKRRGAVRDPPRAVFMGPGLRRDDSGGEGPGGEGPVEMARWR